MEMGERQTVLRLRGLSKVVIGASGVRSDLLVIW